MRHLAVWLVFVSVACHLCMADEAFLEAQLPLKVLVVTPSELGGDAAESVTLNGRQAITVVFSRPVIALGSDWGSEQLPDELMPFTLSCGLPGRMRWVTTNIARFDPSVDWPTDLDCSFDWNQALQAYDGVPLQLGDLRPSVRLQTQPLVMNIQQVQSEAAVAATGGQWSAFLGAPDDSLPEVPPDANVTLSFSYPVDLARLAGSLKVAGPGAGSRTVTVSPCVTPVAQLIPVGSTDASTSPAAAGSSTCAVVKVVPGLEPGVAAVLRLPKGSRYSSIAGPVGQDTDVKVFGLRPFRIPLRWDFMNITNSNEPLYSGVSFRRLTMWLPHGLAEDTSLETLGPSIQLCCLSDPFARLNDSSNCRGQPFDLTRPYPAVLMLRVPALNPRQRCILRIKEDPKVKDGFGLALQSSSDVWWTQDLDTVYTGPTVGQVALLEPAPGNPTLLWPWLSRGAAEEGVSQVQAVSVPVSPASSSSISSSGGLLERVIAGVAGGYGSAAASLLNTAVAKVTRPDATWPTFNNLMLSGQPGVSLIGSCCRQVSWPSTRSVLATSTLVVQSDLQASFIEQQGQLLAWVTSTQGQSRAVKGAAVQVYGSNYGQEAAVPGPSCVTAADGTCTLDLAAAARAAAQNKAGNSAFTPVQYTGQYTAVVTAEGHGPLVVPSVPSSGRYSSSSSVQEYVATLVLDRKLVKPGDELHVTAFIQRKNGSLLFVDPQLKSVTLQVSPGFDRQAVGSSGSSSSSSGPLRITVEVDTTYGTAHAVVPVPRNATPANYNLQLWTPGQGDAANAAIPKIIAPASSSSSSGSRRRSLLGSSSNGRQLHQEGKLPASQSTAAGAAPAATAPTQAAEDAVVPEPVAVEPQLADVAPSEEPPTDAGVAAEAVVPEPQTKLAAGDAAGAAAPAAGQAPMGVSLAYASFTVGDPRPPTASLALDTTSAWVTPDGSVAVSVTSRSYIGSDVSGADVTLSWSSAKAQGELRLVTNATGVATGVVDLSQLPAANRSEVGDTLTLKATWIGPTREPLMQSRTIKIADGPVRVELLRTLLTDVPGVAFGVKADAFSLEDDTPIAGAAVEVSLEPYNASASLSSCSSEQRALLQQQRCSIRSGDPAAASACQLVLPCAGEFVLKGCVRSSSNGGNAGSNGSSGGGCSRPIRLGRNMTAWAAAPWASGPGQLVLLPDKKNVSLGDDVAITLQNPFWGPTSALVVWGNGEQRERFYLEEIPPGPSTMVIQQLGSECRGGCNVVVTLAVARPQGVAAGTSARSTTPSGSSSGSSNSGSSNSQGLSGVLTPEQSLAAQPDAPRGLIGAAPGNTMQQAAAEYPMPQQQLLPQQQQQLLPQQQPQQQLQKQQRQQQEGPITLWEQQHRGFHAPQQPKQPQQQQRNSPAFGSSGPTNAAPDNYAAGEGDLGGSWGAAAAAQQPSRVYNAIWPFNVRVYGLPPQRSKTRQGLLGALGNSARNLLGLTATAAGIAGSGSASTQQQGQQQEQGQRRRRVVAPLPDIPRSVLYDPYAPGTYSAEVSLGVSGSEALSVNVTVKGQSKDGSSGLAVLAPQSGQGEIAIAVRDAGGASVADAEVTLMVVDTAVLDLLPYELQDLSAAMQPKLRAAFTTLHLNSMRVTRAAINATFGTLQRRLISIDPWLPADTQVTPAAGYSPTDVSGTSWMPPPAAVDVPDDVYLRGFTTPLTPMPYRPCSPREPNCQQPMMSEYHSHGGAAANNALATATMVAADGAGPVPAPAAAPLIAPKAAFARVTAEGSSGGNAPGSGASAAAAGAQLRLQQDFKVTPLAKVLYTGPDGTVGVGFKAPDNLGRFVVRAYVAARPTSRKSAAGRSSSGSGSGRGGSSGSTGSSGAGMLYGAGESRLIVRRTVSLMPSLPRQVRVGDRFSAGVLVEAPGTVGDVTVTVSATLQQQQQGPTSNSSAADLTQVLQLPGDSSRTVTLSPDQPQQEVRFEFDAQSTGMQNITFAAAAAAAASSSSGSSTAAAPGGGSAGALRGLKQLLLLPRRSVVPPSSSPAAAAGTAAGASAGAVADQVQLQVPVNAKQGAVTIATSFAVRGSSDGSSWQEGMQLPRAEQGSGSLDLIAGVGSMPAIQAAYTSLADQGLATPARCTSATQSVALSLLPAFLSLYKAPGSTAPSVLTSAQVQLTQAAAAAATGPLTNSRFGLLALEPSCYGGSGGPERADVALNAWAAWLTKQALGANSGNNSSSSSGSSDGDGGVLSSSSWGALQAASQTWVKALERQLVTDAVAARQGSRRAAPEPYADLDTLSWARLVLGPTWTPSVPAKVPSGLNSNSNPPSLNSGSNSNAGAGNSKAEGKDVAGAVQGDLSMRRLTAAALAGNLTLGGQARTGLALLSGSKGATVADGAGKDITAVEAVQRLGKKIVNNMRVSGRTAYVAAGKGARGAAGLSDQALALAFLVDASVDNPLVQKLAAWVAQGAAPPPLFYAATSVSSSPWDAALRSQALTTYDSSTASLTPDLQLTVAAQPAGSVTGKRAPVTLLSAVFTPQQAGKLESSSTPWSGVPSNSSLVFGAQGTGEVSVAAALNFTPADLLPFPTYRGLWVQRALLVQADMPQGGSSSGSNSGSSGGSSGVRLRAVEGGVGLGKIVTVAVQVTSPDDQSDVLVTVLMPGGLEPLDPNVFRDPDAATICSSGADETPLVPGSGNSNSGIAGPRSSSSNTGVPLAKPSMVAVAPIGGDIGGFEAVPGVFRPPPWRTIWPVCPVQITSPERVTFRFAYMRAGTHTVRFKAVAATSGSFVLPPVKASVQQQPEVMGLSPAGALTVCTGAEGGCVAADDAAGGGGAAAAAVPAKGCPEDCNGNGACNLSSGSCICNTGFAGVACGDISTA